MSKSLRVHLLFSTAVTSEEACKPLLTPQPTSDYIHTWTYIVSIVSYSNRTLLNLVFRGKQNSKHKSQRSYDLKIGECLFFVLYKILNSLQKGGFSLLEGELFKMKIHLQLKPYSFLWEQNTYGFPQFIFKSEITCTLRAKSIDYYLLAWKGID